ncbi:MAG: hypothetical protein ACFFB0_15555 [Promethearchaeota archaeon]
MNLSVGFFIFCIIFGVLFLFISLSINYESELWVAISFIATVVIWITGIYVLYFLGSTSRHILFYYKMIKPLKLDHISLNSKFIMSIKDQIYIMFSGFANGVYFIKLKINDNPNLIDKKPKKLPRFIIRLNKKMKIDDLTIKFGEFSGFFRIPVNKGEYVNGNARVFFMPIVLFSKTQNTAEYIIRMLDIVQEKVS